MLDSLGFEAGGAAKLGIAKPISKPASSTSKKRKAAPVKVEAEGPRRRSGRIAGIEATVEVVQARAIEEEKEREVLRVINRKSREQVMALGDMLEDAEEGEKEGLVGCPLGVADRQETFVHGVAATPAPRTYPTSETSDKDAYAEPSQHDPELARLKSAFKTMHLKANAKVTTERVFSMLVHPEPTKCIVCVGDKQGTLGM